MGKANENKKIKKAITEDIISKKIRFSNPHKVLMNVAFNLNLTHTKKQKGNLNQRQIS